MLGAMPELTDLHAMAAAERGLVVVSTARADGSIQSSVVNGGLLAHPVSGVETFAFVTYGRAKLSNLRSRPWATVTARSGWQWVTLEGSAELAGPDDPLPGVADEDVPALLRAVLTAAGGTHDDWDAFDREMVEQRRTAVLITPGRIYSN